MLNCSIYQKKGMAESENTPQNDSFHHISSFNKDSSFQSKSWGSEDWDGVTDQFQKMDMLPKQHVEDMAGSFVRVVKQSPDTLTSLGRKRILEGVKSEKDKLQLWEPVTQRACPMTDDMVLEYEEIIQQFGFDENGQGERVKIQSKSLVCGI
jgi:hypothetical protein